MSKRRAGAQLTDRDDADQDELGEDNVRPALFACSIHHLIYFLFRENPGSAPRPRRWPVESARFSRFDSPGPSSCLAPSAVFIPGF